MFPKEFAQKLLFLQKEDLRPRPRNQPCARSRRSLRSRASVPLRVRAAGVQPPLDARQHPPLTLAALSVTAASYGTERDRDGGGCCAQRGISRRRRRKPRRWRRVREVCDTSTCEFILSNPLLYVKQKHMNYEYPRVRTHVKTSILWTIDFCVSSAHKCYDSYSISLARDVTRERGERV